MSEDIKAVEPLAEQIIRAIKAWFECLKYDYQERVERGPMAHLLGICTEHIMALCRILDEINEMEQAEAVLEDSEHSRARGTARARAYLKDKDQRMAELKREFDDLTAHLSEF